LHIASQSTRGGIVLLAGNVIQTAAVAVASIIVFRLLGPNDSGLFALVVVALNIFLLFLGLGVTVSVTRNVAYYNSLGETATAVRFAKNGIIFTLLTGLALAALALVAAGPIATFMLHRPSLAPYVEQVSVIIMGWALLSACIAAAVGWNAMSTASVSNVTLGVARMVASPLLVAVGLGLEGAVLGYAVSVLLAALVSLVLLFSARLHAASDSLKFFRADVGAMVRFGFPPYVSGVLSGLSAYYVPLVLALFATNSTIGFFSVANAVTVPISLVSGTTGTALFPAFAGLDGMKADMAGAFRRASKYVGYITVPVLFFVAVAAKQFMGLLYGPQFLPGTGFLVLLALSYLPLVAGLGIIPSFFNGIGRTRITLYSIGSATLVLLVLAPVLGESAGLGVDGTIYAILISNVILTLVGLMFFWRLFSATVSLRPLAATLCSGVVSFVLTYLLPSFPSDLLTLIEKLVVFGAVYFTLGPSLGAVNRSDLEFVQKAIGDMRFVARMLSPFLEYQKRVADLVRGSNGEGRA
jgi:O-antigen/teichoic acid export membrane protein